MRHITPFYKFWHKLFQKCKNPEDEDFRYFGRRGITLCEEWENFARFYEDMFPGWKPRATLHRKDKAQGFSRENCSWTR